MFEAYVVAKSQGDEYLAWYGYGNSEVWNASASSSASSVPQVWNAVTGEWWKENEPADDDEDKHFSASDWYSCMASAEAFTRRPFLFLL